MEGVVRAPSLFSITLTSLPSMTATQELVVPRSMPMTLLIVLSFSWRIWPGRPINRPFRAIPITIKPVGIYRQTGPGRKTGEPRKPVEIARLIGAGPASGATGSQASATLAGRPEVSHAHPFLWGEDGGKAS